MTGITDAAGSTVGFDYDALGNVTRLTAPDGATYRNVYDEVGRLTAAIEPSGATTARSYDRRGRVVEVTDPNGHVWRRRVDVLGRTVTSTAPDGATTTFTYHPNGEVATVITPDGRAWRTELDRNGRPVARIDPLGGRAVIEYTAGRPGPLADQPGRSHRALRVRRRRPPGGDDRRRRRAPRRRPRSVVGILATVTDDDGTRVEYRWDDDYRLVGAADRRARARDAAFHDPPRRRRSGRRDHRPDRGLRPVSTWDDRGLLASAVDPAGGETSYRYDARGQLDAIDAPNGGVTGSATAPTVAGSRSPTRPGRSRRFVRDAAGTAIGVRNGDGSGWDRARRRLGGEIERVGTDSTVAARFAYDPGGRLVSVSAPGDAGTIEFLWDDNDQLRAVTGPDGTRRVERDPDGRVTAIDRRRRHEPRRPEGSTQPRRTDPPGPGRSPHHGRRRRDRVPLRRRGPAGRDRPPRPAPPGSATGRTACWRSSEGPTAPPLPVRRGGARRVAVHGARRRHHHHRLRRRPAAERARSIPTAAAPCTAGTCFDRLRRHRARRPGRRPRSGR